MKPYYDEGGITIYHGDCREVLAGIAPCGLVATDPPYNAGKDYGTYKDNLSEQDYAGFMAEVADACLALAPKQFWIAPRYRLPLWLELLPSAHLVVIRRGAAGPYRGGWSDQFEIALAIGKPNRPDSDLWDNIRLKGEGYFFREETFGHPGYTPFPIMARAVALLGPGTVLDPFAGTGTTLVAAKAQNLEAIGIEVDEQSCEIAANRCRQTVMELGI